MDPEERKEVDPCGDEEAEREKRFVVVGAALVSDEEWGGGSVRYTEKGNMRRGGPDGPGICDTEVKRCDEEKGGRLHVEGAGVVEIIWERDSWDRWIGLGVPGIWIPGSGRWVVITRG